MMRVVNVDDGGWPERYVEGAKLAQIREGSKLEGASSPSAKLTSPSTPASRAGLDLASAASFLFVPLFCAAASLLGMPDENCLVVLPQRGPSCLAGYQIATTCKLNVQSPSTSDSSHKWPPRTVLASRASQAWTVQENAVKRLYLPNSVLALFIAMPGWLISDLWGRVQGSSKGN
jgi:hypothetical protein